jgi:hypothetical protein
MTSTANPSPKQEQFHSSTRVKCWLSKSYWQNAVISDPRIAITKKTKIGDLRTYSTLVRWLIVLGNHLNFKPGVNYLRLDPSHETLAREAGCGVATSKRMAVLAAELGFIQFAKCGFKGRNNYKLIFPTGSSMDDTIGADAISSSMDDTNDDDAFGSSMDDTIGKEEKASISSSMDDTSNQLIHGCDVNIELNIVPSNQHYCASSTEDAHRAVIETTRDDDLEEDDAADDLAVSIEDETLERVERYFNEHPVVSDWRETRIAFAAAQGVTDDPDDVFEHIDERTYNWGDRLPMEQLLWMFVRERKRLIQSPSVAPPTDWPPSEA